MAARTEVPLQRVSRRYPCPICGKADWCSVGDLVVICMRVESERTTANGGYLHRLDRPLLRRPAADPAGTGLAPRLERHRVYAALLEELSLSAAHLQALRARGFSDVTIQRRRYRTLPAGGSRARWQLARRIRQLAGMELAGIPGFHLREGRKGPFWTLNGAPGLIIPVQDVDGYIVGAQVRRDNVELGGARYVWLSSSDRPGGASPGAPVHVARPAEERSSDLLITEGPLKADRTAQEWGVTGLAVAGIGNWREVPDVVRHLGRTTVILAPDADVQTNPNVRRHAEALIATLRTVRVYLSDRDAEVPLRLRLARWDGARAKGIDDAVQAGAPVEVVPL